MEEKKKTTKKRYVYLDKFESYKYKTELQIELLEKKLKICNKLGVINLILASILVGLLIIF